MAAQYSIQITDAQCRRYKIAIQPHNNPTPNSFSMAMHLTPDNRLKKLIIIGDRVLVRPTRPNERTQTGLYLPPGVQEKERVQQGYVIKAGPGYAIPMPAEDEPWKSQDEQVKYIPLQAKEGDLAIFLLGGATEIMYEGEKYFIVPQSAILMLEREEEL